MQPTDTIAMLKETPFFSTLDEAELDAVAKCVVATRHGAGQVIIEEGALGECLYLVRSGSVRVEKERNGKKIRLADLGAGATFGEMSLIDSAPTSATVTALEVSELLQIGRLDLNVLLNWNPILASKMWRAFSRMFSERVRDMNDRLLAQ